ncbi:hypothetical protein BCR44DRAFT_1517474 [Catenaria anguillulae PL171]|uniref:Uncharacterized protein n=1 Tax=Catenaria anguillulae PL171 TaxID=765915 RepID=A0A1Y2H865_9FUNG|nr:hypothetical protein BCR44DRAFT_1517474 [Catenaria anguillulae PL171]
MDYLEYCLQQYFYATAWRPDLQYGSLLRDVRQVLDFATPTHAGLSLSVAKPISGSQRNSLLHSRHSVGLGAPASSPSSGSIGFLFTSVPLDPPPPSPSDNDHASVTSSVADKFSAVGVKVIDASALLFSRLPLRDHSSSPGIRRFLCPLQPGTNREKWGHEVCFSSENALFGFRWLRDVSHGWSLGGEVYYLANEVSGGMSLGSSTHRPSRQRRSRSTHCWVTFPPHTHHGLRLACAPRAGTTTTCTATNRIVCRIRLLALARQCARALDPR